LTIKIDQRTKKGKDFLEFAKTFFNEGEEVEIIESNSNKSELVSDSIYSEEFIRKIKKAEENIKTGNTTTLNPNDVWSSLGLN
jgi:hypothetical protein